jgi:PDZ domain-containing secreted protein
MLLRIPIRYMTSLFGIAVVAAATVWFGGNPVQLMLAPVGGGAMGMAISLGITQAKKLPVTATLGDS